MTSCKSNYSQRPPSSTPPPSNTNTWELGPQHRNLGGNTNIQPLYSRRERISKVGGSKVLWEQQGRRGCTRDLSQKCTTTTGNSPLDPNSLPARKRKQLAPGFNKEPLLQAPSWSSNRHEILGFLKPKWQLSWHSAMSTTISVFFGSNRFIYALLIKMLFEKRGENCLLFKMPQWKCPFPKKRM